MLDDREWPGWKIPPDIRTSEGRNTAFMLAAK
jgi:hypothetical protein